MNNLFLLPLALGDFAATLNVLLGVGVGATVLTIVAAIRKHKSGEIVDDDAVIARLDKDNQDLRKRDKEHVEELEAERRKRWRVEDIAARYKRRLLQYEEVEDEPGQE